MDGGSQMCIATTRPAGKPRRNQVALRWTVVGLALAAVGLFVASLAQSWWQMVLFAPQYPKGLRLQILLTGLRGDVRELNMLNHYIGMAPLDSAAPLERSLAGAGVAGLGVVTVLLVLWLGRTVNWLLVVPALLLPVGFVVDSFAWMYAFGHDLDRHAALHVPPFTPQLFGGGKIGQFYTWSGPDTGFWLAVGGVVLLLAAVLVRRRICGNCPLAKHCGPVCKRALVVAPLAVVVLACGPPETVDARATVDAGPQPGALPAGAEVARDGDHLRALLADPKGPAVIGLGNRTYVGDLLVKRPVTVIGSGRTVVEGSGTDTVVRIETSDVTFDNLTIIKSGRRHSKEDGALKATGERIVLRRLFADRTLGGFALQMCHGCRVAECKVQGVAATELSGDAIKLWESHDSRVERCVVDGSRDVVVWYSRRVVLDHNTVRNSRYGTHFMYAHDSVARNSRLTGNVVGIFVMYSQRLHVVDNQLAGAGGAAGIGLGFKDSDAVEARGNWLVGNTTGVYLDRTPVQRDRTVHLSGNVIALNDVALRLHSTERGVRFAGNDVHGNGAVVEVDGGGDALGLTVARNFWSDYAGYDLDRNGLGDVPFEVKLLSGDLVAGHPALKLLRGTLALGLVDAVAQSVPVFSSKLVLRDASPRMRPGKMVGEPAGEVPALSVAAARSGP